jgi:hypothetical protein
MSKQFSRQSFVHIHNETKTITHLKPIILNKPHTIYNEDLILYDDLTFLQVRIFSMDEDEPILDAIRERLIQTTYIKVRVVSYRIWCLLCVEC